MAPNVSYLPDSSIDPATDRRLRGLLSLCFTKPQDWVFHERRYFNEPYERRWVIRDENGALAAHLGLHDKLIESGGQRYRIGGVAEVCVHPDHRGRGYVKAMLRAVHPWLSANGFDFAVLFGDPNVYGSSGYREVSNLFHGGADGKWVPATVMYKPVSGAAWPKDAVRLPGPVF